MAGLLKSSVVFAIVAAPTVRLPWYIHVPQLVIIHTHIAKLHTSHQRGRTGCQTEVAMG